MWGWGSEEREEVGGRKRRGVAGVSDSCIKKTVWVRAKVFRVRRVFSGAGRWEQGYILVPFVINSGTLVFRVLGIM